MKLTTFGRTDLEDFIKLSGNFDRVGAKLVHHPFIVFIINNDEVKVEIIDNISDLLILPDETPVMAQWHGEWRSDFFKFSIGDIKSQLLKIAKENLKMVKD